MTKTFAIAGKSFMNLKVLITLCLVAALSLPLWSQTLRIGSFIPEFQEDSIDKIISPRISELQKQIESGKKDTVVFWEQISKEGTPIVEPFGSGDKYKLVTFLWRGTPETENVFIDARVQVPSLAKRDFLMSRLAETDVWYLTIKLPTGARFRYRISPDDPQFMHVAAGGNRKAAPRADPLNPRRWACSPEDSLFDCLSRADLPGAAPQPWIEKKSGIPEGKIERRQIKSEIQKLERPIFVYLPSGYKSSGQPFPLVVVFDGEDYIDGNIAAPITLNNLIAARKIPPTVLVAIPNVEGRRIADLVPNVDFAKFVGTELIPWLRANYNVTKNRKNSVIGGLSAGGLAAANIALEYSNIFGNVLSQSGAFWWSPDQDIENRDTTMETNWIAKQFAARPKRALRFYLDAGTFEADNSGTGGDILEANRHLRDVLTAKGNEVHYQQFVGAHTSLNWRGTFADGLIALLGTQQ